MGGEYGTEYGGEMSCMEEFRMEAKRKETTW